ncbi:MAG TPA: hypothetical protein VL633_04465 [Bacteroidota bacterium]|jgi:hypothetical protein|nr:hypothetical protein [Bacteroidota bacterium]
MNKKSRRKFLSDLGLSIGALTIVSSLPSSARQKIVPPPAVRIPPPEKDVLNFKYAPASWQSTYCFPDDVHKSLVGNHGELLYGNPTEGTGLDFFPHNVSLKIANGGTRKFIGQKLEEPGVPIVTTTLEFGDVVVLLTCFASNHRDEGRVDNLLLHITPTEKPEIECVPEIVISSASKFWMSKDDDKTDLRLENEHGTMFLASKNPTKEVIAIDTPRRELRYQLKSAKATKAKPLEYVFRFPQEGQSFGKIDGKMDVNDCKELLEEVRKFWKAYAGSNINVQWNLPGEYQNFYVSGVRNIAQAREIKEGQQLVQGAPRVSRGRSYVESAFIIEAACYAGHDQEAKQSLESIWNRQLADGTFSGGAGPSDWKNIAGAIYALVRQAELSQNWEYLRELYPDTVRSMYVFKDLRDKAAGDGTSNGIYKILPRGSGDSGLSGVRPEFTNTLWALIAINHLNAVGRRFFLPRHDEISAFYEELRVAMRDAAKQEMRKHPNGFSYLPMLMKEDPQWSEADPSKQPRPQAAQIYLSQALYPGSQDLYVGSRIFGGDHAVTQGHVELMKAVTKEGVPIETGWLSHDGVWANNGAVLAQTYLWLGMPELARRTFYGFLNHASPLYAWREEQSLLGASPETYAGDMPDAWASAECIRYLRHMMVLEDGERLRLLDGLGFDDLTPKKPLSLTHAPTRWGRVTIALEPLDPKAWTLSFKREEFDQRLMGKLSTVELSSELPGKFQFDKKTSHGSFLKNGPRLTIDPGILEWKATFRDFRKILKNQ